MAIFTGISNSGVTTSILGETLYPVISSATGYTGTITLSAITSLGSFLSGAVGQFAGTLTFTVAPAGGAGASASLSATNLGIKFTIPSYIGPVVHYGFLTSSSVASISSASFQIGFDNGNFLNTVINLSANGTNIAYTIGAVNQVDNPFIVTGVIDNGTSVGGFSAFNAFFRTQGRQARLVQSAGI